MLPVKKRMTALLHMISMGSDPHSLKKYVEVTTKVILGVVTQEYSTEVTPRVPHKYLGIAFFTF